MLMLFGLRPDFICSLHTTFMKWKHNWEVEYVACSDICSTINIVTYHGWVAWLITRRGFGLDTGFIHNGDLQRQQITITVNTSTGSFSNPVDGNALHWYGAFPELTHFEDWLTHSLTLRGLNSEDWSLWFRRLTDWLLLSVAFPIEHSAGPRENTGLPTVGGYVNNTGLSTVGYHATQQYRGGERIHGNSQLSCS
jgi:hypothetical protein